MKVKVSKPIPAAAIILLDHKLESVLWAKRNPSMKFLGGFHGFCGGKIEPEDSLADVRNCKDADLAAHLTAVVRETFEETGVLLVRNGDKLTNGQRISLHDELISARSTFTEILLDWGLWIDADDFFDAGIWTTPEFSSMRFATKFFVALCPYKQTPYSATSEMIDVEFISPEMALKKWAKSEVLIAPPVLSGLRQLAKSGAIDPKAIARGIADDSELDGPAPGYIELNERLICFPLKTDTLPPATHTNCFILGKKEFIVVDPASTYEPKKLFRLIDELIRAGGKCTEIIVSHLHTDHYGGEGLLQDYFLKQHSQAVPVSAHRNTAASLSGKVKIDKEIGDEHSYILQDGFGGEFEIRAFLSPGHAAGHLCFYDSEFGFLLSTDNVVGKGTVVIAPPEGNMSDYLNSLQILKNLPNLRFLCGSHGTAVCDAKGRIQKYIDHRLAREAAILQVVIKDGITDIHSITGRVYKALPSVLKPLAMKSVEAHLEKLIADGRI